MNSSVPGENYPGTPAGSKGKGRTYEGGGIMPDRGRGSIGDAGQGAEKDERVTAPRFRRAGLPGRGSMRESREASTRHRRPSRSGDR